MSDFEAWVGRCHIRDVQRPDESGYECYAAVWTNTREGFDIALHQHLKPHAQSLLWAEDVFPITQWLQRSGHNQAVTGLARTVHAGHSVELGTLTAIGEDGEPAPPPEYLTITEYEIEPLSDQSEMPFWDKEWIAPELKELLFGQPEEGPRLRTYCIVNASLRKHITKVFDLDSTSIDVPIQCLFKGEAADDLREVAPYLLDMTLPDGAWDDRDLVPGFHKDLFEKHWGKNSGVFIRTPALMTEVWNHFRKFTKTAMQEDGNRVFFLFHDPRVLPGYLRNISPDAGKVRCFCTSEDGGEYRFYIEAGETTLFSALPKSEELSQTPRPRFVLSYTDFQPQAEAEKQKRAERVAERLKKDFAAELSGQSMEDTAAFSLKIINRFGEYGFIKQEHLHQFVAWSVFFGEGFETKDPQGVLKDICQSKAPEDDKFKQFKARFEQFTYRPAEAS